MSTKNRNIFIHLNVTIMSLSLSFFLLRLLKHKCVFFLYLSIYDFLIMTFSFLSHISAVIVMQPDLHSFHVPHLLTARVVVKETPEINLLDS